MGEPIADAEQKQVQKTPKPKGKPTSKKTGTKSGKAPRLVKMPHGGSLWCGPMANPVAGPGRPKSEIRSLYAELGYGSAKEIAARLKSGQIESLRDLRDVADLGAKYSIGTSVNVQMSNMDALRVIAGISAEFIPPGQWDTWVTRCSEALANLGTAKTPEPLQE